MIVEEAGVGQAAVVAFVDHRASIAAVVWGVHVALPLAMIINDGVSFYSTY